MRLRVQSGVVGGFLSMVADCCRGICYFYLEVECAKKDLHSGVFGGTV